MKHTQSGITLLLAVLILSSVLSVALGIFYVILVQIQINQNARESYKAFYSAETGLECALFYFGRASIVEPTNYWGAEASTACFDGNCAGTPVVCGNDIQVVGWTDTDINPAGGTECSPADFCQDGHVYTFTLQPAGAGDPPVYADVEVRSYLFDDIDGPQITGRFTKTVITSRGKNELTARPVNRTLTICRAGHRPACEASE